VIPGSRGGPARSLRAAAAVAFVSGSVLALAPPAAAAQPVPSPWARSWSWQADGDRLPAGCAPYSGRSSAGLPWSTSLVSTERGSLRLTAVPAAAGRRATGSGIGCTGKAQRYGRVEVRARVPRGPGLVARVAFWPSDAGHDSGWSGLTVPSPDLGPAYVTNGSGERAYGAPVPGQLAGAFRTYVITWTPQGLSVSVDGKVLYRDAEAFDGSRWLGISFAATGAAVTRAELLVDRIDTFRWVGPLPAAPPVDEAPAAPADTPSAAPADTPASAPAAVTVPPSGTAVPGPQEPAPTAPAGSGVVRGPGDDGTPLLSSLTTGRLGAPWLVGGCVVGMGVLAGIVRAALSSRSRPLTP
jgi:hypothetical protein